MSRILPFKLLLSALLLLPAIGLEAQKPDPVAWETSVESMGEDVYLLRIEARIEAPWHIYDTGPYEGGPNPTTISFESNPDAELIGGIAEPAPPRRVRDELFGMEIGTYASKAVFTQRVRLKKTGDITLKATVEWMACDEGSCLPPEERTLTFTIRGASAGQTAGVPGAEESARTATKPDPDVRQTSEARGNPANETADGQASSSQRETFSDGKPSPKADSPTEDRTDKAEAAASAEPDGQESALRPAASSAQETGGSLWAAIVEAMLWGLAALLTPCVFPMIPMTVSFFMKGSENRTRGRFRALAYGLCIVGLYTLPITIIIVITNLFGQGTVTADIFNWLATHWIPNVIFFLVFMVFAASFFGAFEITMPSRLVNRSDERADRGGLTGIFFMALTLVLVSFSCTGPIVGSVLIKSTSGEIWAPVFTMLAFSVVFALPFTLFALFPSLLNRLPKSGGWLNSVKVVLGFLELALGLKFLSVADQTYHWGILDREVYLALWIVIFSLLGFYLLGKLRFKHDSEVKSIGVARLLLSVVTFSFVVYLTPGMWGAPLKGISGYLPPLETQDFVPAVPSPSAAVPDKDAFPKPKHSDFLKLPHGLRGFFDLDEAAQYARQVGKPLFVDYTGHGCVNCREMEAKVWSDPQVLRLLRDNFVIVALYSDDKKVLPESEWIATPDGRTLKSIGKINAYLAHKRFGINSQPYYLILGPDERPLVPGRGYNLDVQAFVDFLEEGLLNYRALK